NVVKDFGIGEVVVEGESAGYLALANPIDQLDAQLRMIHEGLYQNLTTGLRAKTAERQRIVLAVGADVVDEKIILSDFVAFLGVIPEVTCVGDEVAGMVNQGVVDGDDALSGVTARRVQLQFFKTAVIDLLGVPIRIGEEPVEARLVRGLGELVMDAQNGLAFGDHQTGEILREMSALRFIGEKITKPLQGGLDDVGEFNDGGHVAPRDRRLETPL